MNEKLKPPEGWKLVPVEPTREMWAAMADTLYGYKNRHHDKVAGDLYYAMLAAAPALTSPQGQETPAAPARQVDVVRKRVMRAIFDPGATEGFKGERDLTTWQTDAVMRALAATEGFADA